MARGTVRPVPAAARCRALLDRRAVGPDHVPLVVEALALHVARRGVRREVVQRLSVERDLRGAVDAEDFTTITRDDGATQIAFYGMPLYYFAADAAAGDVKGQGLNDKWYVIGADGTPIK